MKVLITGGSGLLGQFLNIEISKKHEILTVFNSNYENCKDFNSQKLDLTNFNSLENLFNDYKPELVIHTAAYSNSQKAINRNSKEIYKLNVTTTKHIAELCDLNKSKLIYTSTDLVYAGYRGSMLKENEKLIPVSLYAETKLMGEVKIQETFDNYIILRTALLFGIGLNHSKCHFHQLFEDLRDGKEVKLFIDQYRTPLSLMEASRVINKLIDTNIKSEIINFGGLERVSRFELGEYLCDAANFRKDLLVKITIKDVPELPQVKDVSMNTDKLKNLGMIRKSIQQSIDEIFN